MAFFNLCEEMERFHFDFTGVSYRFQFDLTSVSLLDSCKEGDSLTRFCLKSNYAENATLGPVLCNLRNLVAIGATRPQDLAAGIREIHESP